MLCYPLARYGNLIGGPNQGTHTLGNWQSDNAVDIGVPIGTPVVAVEGGEIGTLIGSLGSGGRFSGLRVYVDSDQNSHYYAHLSSLSVRPGQPVRAGDIIGRSGSANGVAHLHYACERGSPYAAARAAICPRILWTPQKKWLWLRWWLGEGEFKQYGPRNVAHRPRSLPAKVPRFVWAWARAFLRHR